MLKKALFLAVCGLSTTFAAPAFLEEFNSGWENKWVKTSNSKFTGVFAHTAGKWYGDKADQTGIQTSENAKHYGISTSFPTIDNKGKTLVLQYTVKHEQKLDCGGAYIKLLPEGADLSDFNGDSPYAIMFGPDMCGPSNRKVHLIFNYKGTNLLWKKQPSCKTDQLTHVYTLILNPDNTYEVQIDLEKVESGNLEDDWDFLKPKKINDPSASKPSNWVDEAQIEDPEDKKPEDWDSEPQTIPDSNAKKPDDWDEDDGAWEPPMKPNPKFKGEWKAKKIANPEYKGPWVHPQIDNPDYVADNELYARGPIGGAGFELWQVTAGSLMDNILVTFDVEEAKEHAQKHWADHKDAEQKAFADYEAAEAKRAEEERKKAESQQPKTTTSEDDEEDDKKEEL